MTEEQRKTLIAAYLNEKIGAEAAGDSERVKLIEERLKQLGAEGSPPRERATKRTT